MTERIQRDAVRLCPYPPLGRLGDEMLWDPSNGAGRLILRQVEVFEAAAGVTVPDTKARETDRWVDVDFPAVRKE